MGYINSDKKIELVKLGEDNANNFNKITPEYIEQKKRTTNIISEARDMMKQQKCILCGKKCSSFCDSHSIPKFVLRNIAKDGMISTTLQGKILFREKNIGINKTGTFHIICNKCDNEQFQDYEDPNAYLKEPTNKMLAQIALKNYLRLISKKRLTHQVFILLGEKFSNFNAVAEEKAYIEKYDLEHYQKKFQLVLKSLKNEWTKYYHLCYYQKLDYVVPYATQTALTLIAGFDDEVINNVYNFSSEYEMKEIHVVIFPLETTSIIMLFVEDGDKRHRKFYKNLNKIPLDDQLATINYIVFAYTEDVYINPVVVKKTKEYKNFYEITRLTADTTSNFNCSSEMQLSKAIKEFSLSRRHEIPNLLSREYALPSDNKEV